MLGEYARFNKIRDFKLMPISQKIHTNNHNGFAPVLVIIIVALLVGGVAVSTGKLNLFFNKPSDSPVPSESSQTASSWETYKNNESGYSIKYPKGWVVKDQSESDKRGVSVMQPENLANVLIIGTLDKSIKDKAGMESAIESRKKHKQTESGLEIANFKSQAEEKKSGWILVGVKTIDGQRWVVMERGLLDIYGKVLIEQSGYLAEGGGEYKDVVSQILDSFSVE